ncbi:acyl-CoA synthetase [Inmirania thermothiophila]|uniref:Acyl-coenzyme A synthetase/AMP-(Fatty) acid ligase n=1 Tax=Inmirania thermothiophila TaxID=1750597 RepID=A0A3N1Y1R8_9GAMM|nr:acyl-CoA synthetase [Inmirania thermothiophila]ROR32766.1 acyl-coenzyme A synthetase/AMP-(fatty) acid ligase [Inmirania thermothiophila]
MATNWQWAVPARLNIGAACTDAQVEAGRGGETAMVVEDAVRGTAEATYEALSLATSRFAQLLEALGVGRGERVLVRLPNSLAYPTAFLGAIRHGAIAVPTSTLLVGPEVRYLAEDSGAAVLVTDKAMWPELAPHLGGLPALRHVLLAGAGPLPEAPPGLAVHDLEEGLAAQGGWHPAADTAADDPAYLVYTSGTTGYPKGVLHAHRALVGRLPAATHWFDFREGEPERILHTGKFNWTYVLGSALMDPLYHGKTVIVHEGPNDPARWIELIARHRCTVFIGVPTIYRQILQRTGASRADVPTLRHCMCAGEHLSDEVFAAWRARFGLDIYEAIGMSEISYYISHSRHRPIRPGSAGFPQPGHEVRLLDASLREVGVDEEGMICIRDDDPGLFLRYWNLPEETARSRRGGWFLTGDYARRDADGYIWFLGRRDDLINSFGYRISPHEVERVMKAHPEVADCAVIGQAVDAHKTLVAACVVPVPGARPDPEALLAWARERLAGYKQPKIVHILEELPRTRNGKVLRSELRRLLETRRT